MSPELPPFSCTYSPHLPELLTRLHCSVAISTYQAGKVIVISAKNREQLVQLPRNFKKPMGIALHGEHMAIATQTEVVTLHNAPSLAANYPKSPNTYDGLFLPRATYFTGELDIHDLHFTPDGLLAVNTRFSCLALINDQYSFTPVWQPSFIKSLQPFDHCHLNGLALVKGKPTYASALGTTDTPNGWRATKANGGVLIDIPTHELIVKGLPMPHSPRMYGGYLFLLLSATGELIHVDVKTGKYQVIQKFNGFVRGMDRIGDYLFIGLSKLRTTSKAFGDLPIASQSPFCGVVVFHLPTGRQEGFIRYENSVEEIFDVRILPGMNRPCLLNHDHHEHIQSMTLPQGSYWATQEGHKENADDRTT